MIEFERMNPCQRHGKTTEAEMAFNSMKKDFWLKMRKNSASGAGGG
jgi:hypothetical protein